jgi:hypothetical protein
LRDSPWLSSSATIGLQNTRFILPPTSTHIYIHLQLNLKSLWGCFHMRLCWWNHANLLYWWFQWPWPIYLYAERFTFLVTYIIVFKKLINNSWRKHKEKS